VLQEPLSRRAVRAGEPQGRWATRLSVENPSLWQALHPTLKWVSLLTSGCLLAAASFVNGFVRLRDPLAITLLVASVLVLALVDFGLLVSSRFRRFALPAGSEFVRYRTQAATGLASLLITLALILTFKTDW
jgi:hypothetical protein